MRDHAFSHVGAFHFVDGFEAPITKLTSAIESKEQELGERITNALIVLPEAFNIGREYDPGPRELSSCGVIDELRGIAADRNTVFVVGILEGRCNVAYWVDGEGRRLMSHKIGDDKEGIYDPCRKMCDEENPIVCSNAIVSALICMDAWDPAEYIAQRREALLETLRSGPHTRILAVPARTNDRISTLKEGVWSVVANGIWRNYSCIISPSGELHETNGQTAMLLRPLSPATA